MDYYNTLQAAREVARARSWAAVWSQGFRLAGLVGWRCADWFGWGRLFRAAGVADYLRAAAVVCALADDFWEARSWAAPSVSMLRRVRRRCRRLVRLVSC